MCACLCMRLSVCVCVPVCASVPVCVQCSDDLWKVALCSGSDGPVAPVAGRTGNVPDECCLL